MARKAGISIHQAISDLFEIFKAHVPTIPGLVGPVEQVRQVNMEHPNEFSGIFARWDRGWGASASFEISFRENKPGKDADLRVVLNWGSTQRGVSGAVAFLNLATQVTNLAALLEDTALRMKVNSYPEGISDP